jgi:hypothetical protein
MIPGIEVKIGADTSGLDAALAKAGTSLDRAGATAARAGAAMASGLGRGVTQASANVSRSFGLIEGAAARLALKSSTAMSGLGNAFTGAGQGAVKASDTTARALERMSDAALQSSARTGAALDSALAKYLEFGRASTAIPGNLPGLGGTSIGLPDPFIEPNKGAEKFSGSIGNIAAQFNDIGVTAAMGMSPLMIALQQGTQLSQVFAGQKLGDVARGLGSAFMSMVSPVSLVTLGLVAVAAAAAQWAIGALSAGSNAKTFAENLDAAGTALDDLRGFLDNANSPLAELEERFGTNAAKAQELYVALARLQTLQAMAALSEAAASATEELSGLENRLLRIDQVAQTGQGAAVMAREVRKIGEEFGLTEEQARLVLQRMEELGAAQGPAEIARAAGSLADALSVARDEAGQIPPQIAALAQKLLEASLKGLSLEDAVLDAKKAADDLAASGPGSGWLSNAIGAAETLGSKLWDAWRAKTALENVEGGFEPVGEGDLPEGASRPPPRAPAELGIPDIPARGGVGTGGGARGPSLADRLETLRDELATEQETIAEWYAQNMQTLDDALAARALKEQEYRDLREKLEAEHEDRLRGIRGAGQQSALATVLSTGQQILQAVGQTNQKALKAAQAFGAGIALINAYQAASETLKQPGLPWFARIAAAGQVLAAGIGFANAIKGVNASASGVTSGAGRGAGAAQPVQGPSQTISISYDGPDFARQPIEAVVGQLNDFIKRGGRIDGVMMA